MGRALGDSEGGSTPLLRVPHLLRAILNHGMTAINCRWTRTSFNCRYNNGVGSVCTRRYVCPGCCFRFKLATDVHGIRVFWPRLLSITPAWTKLPLELVIWCGQADASLACRAPCWPSSSWSVLPPSFVSSAGNVSSCTRHRHRITTMDD